jgi:hypothetical protein
MSDEQTLWEWMQWFAAYSPIAPGGIQLPLPKGADEVLEPFPDPFEDGHRVVTLEVAIEAQILLANLLRFRMLPSFFYNLTSREAEALEQMVQKIGIDVNIVVEAPGIIQKWLKKWGWLLKDIVPHVPDFVQTIAYLNTAFRFWLDTVVIVNRERLAVEAAKSINAISKQVFADLRNNYLFSDPGAKRARRKVYSRNP